MIKHPLPKQFEDYLANRLAPGELLEFDDHLAECKICRAQLSAPEHLKSLSDSVVNSLGAKVSADQSESFTERISKQMRFIGIYLNSIRKTAGLVYLTSLAALIIIITGIFIKFQNKPLADLTARREQSLETNSIFESKEITTDNQKQLVIRETERQNSSKQQSFEKDPKPFSKSVKDKPTAKSASVQSKKSIDDRSWVIDNLIVDESQMLSSNNNSKELPTAVYELIFSRENKQLNFRVNNARQADEFEFYLAELPKLSTVKRQRNSTPFLSIPENLLVQDRSYVLQVTVWRDGKSVDSLKKIIRSETKKVRKGNKN